jgi:hypothetical protein
MSDGSVELRLNTRCNLVDGFEMMAAGKLAELIGRRGGP